MLSLILPSRPKITLYQCFTSLDTRLDICYTSCLNTSRSGRTPEMSTSADQILLKIMCWKPGFCRREVPRPTTATILKPTPVTRTVAAGALRVGGGESDRPTDRQTDRPTDRTNARTKSDDRRPTQHQQHQTPPTRHITGQVRRQHIPNSTTVGRAMPAREDYKTHREE